MLFSNILGTLAALSLSAAGTAYADSSATATNGTTDQWKLDLSSVCNHYATSDSATNSSFPWKEVCSHITEVHPHFNATLEEVLFTAALPSSLQDFLDQYSINFNVSDTSSTIQGLMKLSYDSIRNNINTFDPKPFEAFFNNYNIESLKKWMEDHGIHASVKTQASKEKLVKMIVTFIHQSLVHIETERYEILDSLDIFNKNVFNHQHNISSSVFSQFSAQELNKWLDLHNIPLSANLTDSKEYLSQRAQEHFDLFQNDVEWYLLRYKTMASPFIGKSPEQVESAWKGISDMLDAGKDHAAKHLNNETLVNIESWSQEKFASFMDMLGSKNITDTSVAEFLQKIGTNLTLSVDKLEWNFGTGESVSNFRNWALNTSSHMLDSDLYADLNGKIKSLGDGVCAKAKQLNEYMDNMFQSWSVEDLKTYVNKIQNQFTAEPVKEETLMDKAKTYTRKILGYEPEPKTNAEKYMNKIKQYANELYHVVMPAQ